MTVARHTYKAREVGFFAEVALSPLSVSSVEWDDKKGVVEIYTTPDPLHTLRDIANWTKFTKPGSSGSFDVPAGTRKIAIEATSAPVVGEPLRIFDQGDQSFRMLFRTGQDNWPDSVIELDTFASPGWIEHGFSVGDVCRISNPFLLAEEFIGDYEITSFNVAPKSSGTTVDDWARVRRVDGKTMPNVDDPGLADFDMIPQATSNVFPTAVVISDGLIDMEQARLYGVDQLDSPVPPPAPPVMPFATTAELWYDFTDVSTLFQNTGGSTPVTLTGHPIRFVANKGLNVSAGAPLKRLAGAAVDITWDSDVGGFGAGVGINGDHVLGSTPTGHGADTNPFTIFWVGKARTPAGNVRAGIGWSIMNSEYNMRVLINGVFEQRLNGAVFEGTDTIGQNELLAGYAGENGPTQQSYRTHGEAEINTANAAATPASGTDFNVFSDDTSPTTGFTWNGEFFEVVVTVNDYANRALWEAYVTDKYGIAWV